VSSAGAIIEGIKPRQVSHEKKGLQTSSHAQSFSPNAPTSSMLIDRLSIDNEGSMIKKPMNMVKMMVSTFINTKVKIVCNNY
jgi:hypothetical protein